MKIGIVGPSESGRSRIIDEIAASLPSFRESIRAEPHPSGKILCSVQEIPSSEKTNVLLTADEFRRFLSQRPVAQDGWTLIDEILPCVLEDASFESVLYRYPRLLFSCQDSAMNVLQKMRGLFLLDTGKTTQEQRLFLIQNYVNSLSVEEVRMLEERVQKCGFSERVMIENAGRAVAEVFEAHVERGRQQRIVVLAGEGNNGADALVAGRDLLARGWPVFLYQLRSRGRYSPALQEIHASLSALSVPVQVVSEGMAPFLTDVLQKSTAVLDGMLGIGLRGEPEGLYADCISAVNSARDRMKTVVFSIDIPSGMNGDSGKTRACVCADYTVTFFGAKKGFYFFTSHTCCGTILIKDIGVSRDMLLNMKFEARNTKF